jgi:hypothetical protein
MVVAVFQQTMYSLSTKRLFCIVFTLITFWSCQSSDNPKIVNYDYKIDSIRLEFYDSSRVGIQEKPLDLCKLFSLTSWDEFLIVKAHTPVSLLDDLPYEGIDDDLKDLFSKVHLNDWYTGLIFIRNNVVTNYCVIDKSVNFSKLSKQAIHKIDASNCKIILYRKWDAGGWHYSVKRK